MKKGINAWCFPSSLTMEEKFACAKENGFEGIEINMSENDPGLSLKLTSTEGELQEILALSKQYDLPISSVSTSLHWQFPITSNDKAEREKGKEIVRKMIDAACVFGADTVLVVPGCVEEEVSYDVAYDRALEGFVELKSYAESKKVFIGVENVWNKFLLSPLEMRDFLDKISSDYVKMYLDAGNLLVNGYPEQWVRILGKRIVKIHLKDFDTSIGSGSGFKNLLHGDLNWERFIPALREVGYDSYLTAELGAYKYNPLGLIKDTSVALDYILGL